MKRLLGNMAWLVVVMVFVAFGVGYWIGGGAGGQDAAAAKQAPSNEIWTCSMHPQIRMPSPGKCPICGMDLTPVSSAPTKSLMGMRQITISPHARELMQIRTTPVERRFVTASVHMVGKVAYDETKLGYITAWFPGRLDRMFVDYTGVQVRKGDHMAMIYSPELYAAQQELISAVRSRREAPGRSDIGGVNLVESAREKLWLLGLKEEQISEIEKQDRPSDHMTIHAPMGGIVIQKHLQEGAYVKTGERIYTVADLSVVWVMLEAYESDLSWIRYGQQATFTTEAYPGEQFVGRIAFIDPVLNDTTRTVKVRVNVPNPQGKLKPDMFVRGTVYAEIAGAGKVVDEDLVGKWISPMHPEIVKDAPGMCDVCGMPLVRAETLGYVSESQDSAPPLVIPASAVLLTGRRAVVYVELAREPEPLYEGREVVLGPRAGDFYLVQSGLREGELVVTSGNFKIDSALQIQAKPSMMSPDVGGGTTGHDHDHGKHQSDAPSSQAPPSLPHAFQTQLQKLDEAFVALTQAMQTKDVGRIRAALARFGESLARVDPSELPDHPKMLWQEFQMLLHNDVVEGRNLQRLPEFERLFESMSQTTTRVRQQLGVRDQPERLAQRMETPAEFQRNINAIWLAYLDVQTALAGDDLKKTQDAFVKLEKAAAFEARGLSEKAQTVWAKEQANLKKIVESLKQEKDLNGLRAEFQLLSGEVEVLVHRFGVEGDVFKLHCPMAFGDRGAAWLQNQDDVLNPYFGSAMLRCADKVTKISQTAPLEKDSKEPEDHKEHKHEH